MKIKKSIKKWPKKTWAIFGNPQNLVLKDEIEKKKNMLKIIKINSS